MKEKILEISVEHWNKRFVGISALDIAEKLNISHESALSLLEELKTEKKGALNENITLYQIAFEFKNNTNDFKFTDANPVITHIFFPSKQILENYYQENLIKFINNGEYTNRLHRGYNQINLIYFDINVLSKFLNNKEMYSLDDDVTGGFLKLNSEFISNMPEEELDKIWFDKVWYGKRRMINGEITVSAILNDLSGLPKKEQSYWCGFEKENPQFNKNDTDFLRFVSRAYYGNWTESKDPIQDIKKIIKETNQIFTFKIFKTSDNPYLNYPVNNTFKEFVDCNSELYKLIGCDNLKLSTLRKIYLEFCNGSESDLIYKDSQRRLSPLKTFEVILNQLNYDLSLSFKRLWDKVKQNRIEGDHKIIKPLKNIENYIDNFREICTETKEILEGIKIEFKKINSV